MRQAVLAVLLCATVASALYEDRAGKSDWVKNNVGNVRAAATAPYAVQKRAVVATDSGVVAGLAVKSGALLWRNVLPKGEVATEVRMSPSGKRAVTISNGWSGGLMVPGGVVRMWSCLSGAMLWDEVVDVDIQRSDVTYAHFLDVDADGDGENDLLVVHSRTTELRSGATGRLVKSGDFKGVRPLRIVPGATAGSVVVVGLDSSDALVTTQLEAKTFEAGEERTFPKIVLGNPRQAKAGTASFGKGVVATVDTAGVVSAVDVKTGDVKSISVGASLPGTGAFSLESSQFPGPAAVVARRAGSNAAVVVTHSAEGLVKAAVFEGEGLVVAMGGSKDSFLAAGLHTTGAGLVVQLASTGSSSVTSATISNTTLATAGRVQGAYVSAAGDDSNEDRVMVVMENHEVLAVAGGKLAWSRDEALALVDHAVPIDMPPANLLRQIEKEELSPLDSLKEAVWESFGRLVMEGAMKISFLEAIAKEHFPSLHANLIHDHEREEVSRDAFGMKKIIVAASRPGMVFGIHSESGRVLWRLYQPNSDRSALPTHRLFVLKGGLHYPSEVALISQELGSLPPRLTVFDPVTGAVISSVTLPGRVLQATTLPFHDEDYRYPLLAMMEGTLECSLYPDTPAMRSLALANVDSIHFHVAEEHTGLIRGYGLAETQSGAIHGHLRWSFSVGSRIDALATRERNDVSSSSVSVLGDRSVLYKFLNPHVIAAATVNGGAPDGSVDVYVVDGVTGVMYNHVHLPFSTGPVQVIHSENWVIVTCRNLMKHRTEVHVLDMYTKGNEDWWEAYSAGSDSHAKQSSHEGVRPYFLTKTYVFPAAVAAMAATVTAHGITSKQVLFGLASDKVMAVDRAMLDARRPVVKNKSEVTPEMQAEGLIPYAAALPYDAQKVISYNQTVAGIRDIITFPAVLESPSIAFAYGLDLFLTPTFPSSTFDNLTDDFNYFLLIVTITALVVATIVTERLSRSAQLQLRWK